MALLFNLYAILSISRVPSSRWAKGCMNPEMEDNTYPRGFLYLANQPSSVTCTSALFQRSTNIYCVLPQGLQAQALKHENSRPSMSRRLAEILNGAHFVQMILKGLHGWGNRFGSDLSLFQRSSSTQLLLCLPHLVCGANRIFNVLLGCYGARG